MAGVSTLGVTEKDSLETIHAALDAGINFIDTAFAYGYDGESDKLVAQVLEDRRSEVVLASKVGQFFDLRRRRQVDGRPETLIAHTERALRRLRVDRLDLLYLHLPDPNVPIEESAAGIAEVVRRGWVRYAGVSNVTLEQLEAFDRVCPVGVVQSAFNMMQQSAVAEIREFCSQREISIVCYWALMKGLLAGKLARDHPFDPNDRRLSYPIFRGEAWNRSQDLLDKLRDLAATKGRTVAQIVLAWTLAQPGITVALCGAKRPEQIAETAAAMGVQLDEGDLHAVNGWISEAPFE